MTAHIYDMQYAEEQNAKIEAALESLDVEKYGSMLDVGCGTGLLFDYVAEKTEELIGLDTSRKILLQAKKRSERFANTHLILADADNMPFEDCVFNYVFAMTIIQNMPNPEKTVDEVKRVAKKTGVMVITGLKKKFPFEVFEDFLRKLSLNVIEIKGENLKCHVAVCSKPP